MSKFKVGDIVRLLASPADLNKSAGMIGRITANTSCVINSTGELAHTYGLLLAIGPNGQQVYHLAAAERHLEKLSTSDSDINALLWGHLEQVWEKRDG